jgi:hypothetical protein
VGGKSLLPRCWAPPGRSPSGRRLVGPLRASLTRVMHTCRARVCAICLVHIKSSDHITPTGRKVVGCEKVERLYYRVGEMNSTLFGHIFCPNFRMETKRSQFFILWTHFISIPNYRRELRFGQVAVEIKVQFQIPYYGVWILDANFGSRWRCS